MAKHQKESEEFEVPGKPPAAPVSAVPVLEEEHDQTPPVPEPDPNVTAPPAPELTAVLLSDQYAAQKEVSDQRALDNLAKSNRVVRDLIAKSDAQGTDLTTLQAEIATLQAEVASLTTALGECESQLPPPLRSANKKR